LNAFYVLHPISSVGGIAGVASVFIALVFAVALYVSMRKASVVFLALVMIATPLLPVLYIPALGENTFAERYLYLPSVGFVLLLALLFSWMIQRAPRGRSVAVGICLVLTALYSVATLQRNPIWKDDLTLWTDTVGKSPDGALPRLQLGIAHAEAGDPERALEQYRIALEIDPEFSAVYSNMGLIYSDTGRPDRAIGYFREALRLKPSSFAARNNLGVAYSRMGRSEDAIEQFRASLGLQPLQPGVHNNLGNEYRQRGLFDRAIAEYRKALALQPDDADAYNDMGVAYGQMGRADDAVASLLSAVRIDPDRPSFHHNLSNAYRMKGFEPADPAPSVAPAPDSNARPRRPGRAPPPSGSGRARVPGFPAPPGKRPGCCGRRNRRGRDRWPARRAQSIPEPARSCNRRCRDAGTPPEIPDAP
jgi:tetratricopeptide (TPR) repeat protein